MIAQGPIINLDELVFDTGPSHGERFDGKLARVGMQLGARKLGYNVTRLAPGKRAFPFHSHHINEEMFFVLQGSGTLRFGPNEFAVRQGDFIACAPGGPEVAHQLINTGSEELMYIAVSTRGEGDVWSYPDSGKFGVIAGVQLDSGWPPKASFPARYIKDGQDVDYWDGE